MRTEVKEVAKGKSLKARASKRVALAPHKTREKYLIDRNGKASAVVLDMKSYRRLLAYIEDLEDALELKHAIETAEGFTRLEDFEAELKDEGRL